MEGNTNPVPAELIVSSKEDAVVTGALKALRLAIDKYNLWAVAHHADATDEEIETAMGPVILAEDRVYDAIDALVRRRLTRCYKIQIELAEETFNKTAEELINATNDH